MNNIRDNFELIASDAVQALIAAALTEALTGDQEFADALAAEAEALCKRAIALGDAQYAANLRAVD